MKKTHLSITQHSMWNLQKYYSGTAISNNCGVYYLNRKFDYEIVKKAINLFVKTQEEMRAQFHEEAGTVYKYIIDYYPIDIPYLLMESETECEKYAKEMATTPMEMYDSEMYRFRIIEMPSESVIIVCLNHMIADGWSFALMARILSSYCDKLHRHELIDEDVISYEQYLAREEKYLKSNRYQKDKDFWKNMYGQRPDLCFIKPHMNGNVDVVARRYSTILDGGLYKKIVDCGFSPAVVFEGAFALYLSRINGNKKMVTLGMPVLNRTGQIEKQAIGMFITTSLLNIQLEQKQSVLPFLQDIGKKQLQLFRHMQYPTEHIQAMVHNEYQYSGRLYDVLISYQNAKSGVEGRTTWVGNGYSEIPLAFHIDNRDSADCFTINIDYQAKLFHESEVTMLFKRIAYIVEQMLDDMEQILENIEIIPKEERTLLLDKFNDTYVAYHREKCIQELFAECVKDGEDRIALIYHDKRYTYKQIDEMSNSLAYVLRKKGVRQNIVVPIIAKRSWQMIVAMFGIMKAGGAYLHIDSTYPTERIEHMLQTAQSELALVYGYHENLNISTIDLGTFDYSENTCAVDMINEPRDLCYVVFTSGSTGKPKGLMIRHFNAVNYCNRSNRNVSDVEITAECSRILATTTTSFDMAVTETLFPLLNKMTIILADDEQIISQLCISQLVEKYQVDVLQTTPTKMRIYLRDDNNLGYLKKVKTIILGGEGFALDVYQKLKDNSNARIFNNYGPAETTVWSTFKEVTDTDITVGKPISNTQVYVLNESKELLPIGVPGEIYIAGEGVGSGYINQMTLTKERFIPNPFGYLLHHGPIMYSTGDLGVWNNNGELVHLGRIDSQVKIRGLRIELDEIELTMRQKVNGIIETAVDVKTNAEGKQFLIGYYVADEKISDQTIRFILQHSLPQYMIPHYFIKIDRIPMTLSGKISRKDLPQPDELMLQKEYVAPSTQLQKVLVEIWKEVLEQDTIGVTDSFFELGGDSLRAIEFVTEAETHGIKIPLQTIFVAPTISQLEEFLLHGKQEQSTYDINRFDKYDAILKRNIYSDSVVVDERKYGRILLTGATGFLGSHILHELLLEGNEIYCVVRGDEDKFSQNYIYYFGQEDYENNRNRIVLIQGDLTNPSIVNLLPDSVDTIIHAAASVKHYGLYEELYDANVSTTEVLLEYAKQKHARFVYISTISVSGNGFTDTMERNTSTDSIVFRETDIYLGQPLTNVYVRSKFEAECKVLDAVIDGLDAQIIRVGNLTNRKRDFVFQPNYISNAYLNRVRAILDLKMIPEHSLDFYVEFSYVDETAKGILELIKYAKEQNIFHLYNSKHLYFDKFLEMLKKEGIFVDVVSNEIFIEKLRRMAGNKDTSYIYDALQNDFNAEGKLDYLGNIRVVNDNTLRFLTRIGFEWSEISQAYIKGYLEYFQKLHFWNLKN